MLTESIFEFCLLLKSKQNYINNDSPGSSSLFEQPAENEADGQSNQGVDKRLDHSGLRHPSAPEVLGLHAHIAWRWSVLHSLQPLADLVQLTCVLLQNPVNLIHSQRESETEITKPNWCSMNDRK